MFPEPIRFSHYDLLTVPIVLILIVALDLPLTEETIAVMIPVSFTFSVMLQVMAKDMFGIGSTKDEKADVLPYAYCASCKKPYRGTGELCTDCLVLTLRIPGTDLRHPHREMLPAAYPRSTYVSQRQQYTSKPKPIQYNQHTMKLRVRLNPDKLPPPDLLELLPYGARMKVLADAHEVYVVQHIGTASTMTTTILTDQDTLDIIGRVQ
jgi:hypothetical protein